MKSKKIATDPDEKLSDLSRRHLVREFMSYVTTKAQEENGEEEDCQAPITLLHDANGKPKEWFVPSTDEEQVREYREALKLGLPFRFQLHHEPTDAELMELSRQLPPPPPTLRLAPAPTPSIDDVEPDADGNRTGTSAISHVEAEEAGRAIPGGRSRGRREKSDLASAQRRAPAPAARVEPQLGKLYVLRIRRCSDDEIVAERGGHETVEDARRTLDEFQYPGCTAVICEDDRVAWYCDERAIFVFSQRSWVQQVDG
jgi:hypothetical protein